MAASVRGVVQLAGRDLVFDINALCEIEARFDGQSVTAIFQSLETEPRISTLRSLVAIGLGVGDAEAGQVMQQAGIPAVGDALAAAFKAAFPEAKDEPADPQ